jgi:hypothetical protein
MLLKMMQTILSMMQTLMQTMTRSSALQLIQPLMKHQTNDVNNTKVELPKKKAHGGGSDQESLCIPLKNNES